MPAPKTRDEQQTDLSGHIFSVQRFCTQDGPGIRTTVFFKGCPLACPWCHNPESWSEEAEIWLLEGHCITCGACREQCPQTPSDCTKPAMPLPVNGERCLRCGSCVDACPTGARQRIGRTITVPVLLAELKRDEPFYAQSGGGITFSGGEPLLQAEFLLACLQACREAGLHTALDTSGYAPEGLIDQLATGTDLWLFDLKLVDDARHRELTGVSVLPILANLRRLDAAGEKIWIRVPVIPGVNDDDSQLAAIGEVVAGLQATRRVHLLPYHEMGAEKHQRLGHSDHRGSTALTVEPAMARTTQCLAAYGLDVHVGG